MDNLSNFLSGLTSEESLFFLAFILGGFLLGMLLGSLLRSAAIRRLKKDLAKKNEELIDLQGQHNALIQKNAQQEDELNALKEEKEGLISKLGVVEEENSKLHKTVFQLNNEYDKLKSSSQSYEDTIEDLNNQIIGLKAKIETMDFRPATSLPPTDSDEEISEDDHSHLSTDSPMVVDLSSVVDQHQEDRLNQLEEKLDHLMGENNLLRREVEALKEDRESPVANSKDDDSSEDIVINDPFFPQDGADINSGTSSLPETAITGAFSPQDRSLQDTMAAVQTEEGQKDDLTLIEGIGPFIEQKLNDIGIYTYEQISQFADEDIEEVTEKIQFFEGRIKKDDWVNQAKSLHQIKLQNPDAFVGAEEDEAPDIIVDLPEVQENLKVIEGIGPKIEELLKDNDINTVQDIAVASATHLQEILESGGDKFRLHDPTTWPAQARLAVNGDWELLKEYQDKLKGGREVDEKE